MAVTMQHDDNLSLDRWAAKHASCADFKTFLTMGGSVAAARLDIDHRIKDLTAARRALLAYDPMIGPEALSRMEAEQTGKALDADR
jgi:hypothetical protein